MPISSATLRRLSALDISPEALREVLAIIAEMRGEEEAREEKAALAREKDRDRKRRAIPRNSTGNSTEIPRKDDGNSTEAPSSPSPPRDINSTPLSTPTLPPSAGADTAPDPETELFRRGKEILGRKAGGQITKLLQHFDRSVPKARAAIEIASTKENPSEYIAAVLQGRMARAGPTTEKRNSVFAAGQELLQEHYERNS